MKTKSSPRQLPTLPLRSAIPGGRKTNKDGVDAWPIADPGLFRRQKMISCFPIIRRVGLSSHPAPWCCSSLITGGAIAMMDAKVF